MKRLISFAVLLLSFRVVVFAQPSDTSKVADGGAYVLSGQDLAVIVNDNDPHSIAVAEYYRTARRIPATNFIHVRIPGSPQILSAEHFKLLKEDIDAKISPAAQAIVMMWTAPYAVGCNSITSAISLGYDAGQCANTCAPGKASSYFDATSSRPFSHFGIRPSMLLPTDSIEQAKALIDRGVQSGFRLAPASAYFLVTSDAARNSRVQFFPQSQYVASAKLRVRKMREESLVKADDIMVYQIGAASSTLPQYSSVSSRRPRRPPYIRWRRLVW